MEFRKTVLVAFLFCLSVVPGGVASAGDFDWLRDLNIRAQSDMTGFRARLAARFRVGNARISTVLSNVARPADAYMVFRFAEMSGRPVPYVIDRYRSERSRGWGVFAKSLGIKPGSSEFQALKRGSGLYPSPGKGRGRGKEKRRGHGRGKKRH